jgi:hypothetical protein
LADEIRVIVGLGLNSEKFSAHSGIFSFPITAVVAIESEPGIVCVGGRLEDESYPPVRIDLPSSTMDELAMEWLYARGLITSDQLIEIRGAGSG